jgi:hypothetical protein
MSVALHQRIAYHHERIAKLNESIRTAADRGMRPRTIALYHSGLRKHTRWLAEAEAELRGHRCPMCGHIC